MADEADSGHSASFENKSASIDPSLVSQDDTTADTSNKSSEINLPLHSSVLPLMDLSNYSFSKGSKQSESASRHPVSLPSPIRRDSYTITEVPSTDRSNLPDVSDVAEYPAEQVHWAEVNDVLRDHGFNPVILSHLSQARASSSGYVALNEHNGEALRHTLLVMMKDCDRRQGLIHELVASTRRLQ